MLQSQSIIVIHPGSRNLRIGRASDLNPQVMLHAIARRRHPEGKIHIDPILPPIRPVTEQQKKEIEDTRLQVSHTLHSCLQSTGARRYATPPQQVAAFNRRVQPEMLQADGSVYVKPDPSVNAVYGDDVIHLDPALNFNLHMPWRRGDLNIHDGPGGSMTAVIADLEAIWTYAITVKLNISKQSLKNYRAVLVIPDIYNRTYLRELMWMLFSMGFCACVLLQDHVAATFGAGLTYACVVDVGDQKTSISCVEDALCHANTRVRLNLGGADVTQCFHWLLQKCGFPLKNCDPQNRSSAQLLYSLKESFCHVNLDICGSNEKSFVVRDGESLSRKYTIQVGDEAMVAPLGLFSPELLAATAECGISTQARHTGHSEDPYDDIYLRETSRRKEREETTGPDETMETTEDEIVVDSIETTNSNKEFVMPPQQLLGLDQAILQSIDRCPTDEIKRKMYGCVLVVGAGMKFHGIGKWLQNRIVLHTPFMYRPEKLDVITNPKDMDPGNTAWKGAGILICLESAKELWIRRAEFDKWGVKVLRERAPFLW